MSNKVQNLFCSSIRDFLFLKVILYAAINFLLLTGLFITKFANDFSLAIPFSQHHLGKDFIEFIPLFSLVFPCFMLIPTIFNFRNNPSSIINKKELDSYAYETIIPSINSWLGKKHFILRIGIFFLMFLIILPILNALVPTKLNSLEIALPRKYPENIPLMLNSNIFISL